jgi:methionine salvage enolase-phosphatase E1
VATASALSLEGLVFVSYDDRQADAARAVGLRVLHPGRERRSPA